jgi:hypothetical protein
MDLCDPAVKKALSNNGKAKEEACAQLRQMQAQIQRLMSSLDDI